MGTNIDISIVVRAGFLTLVGMGTAILLLLSLIVFIKLSEIITKKVKIRRAGSHGGSLNGMDVKDQMVAASVAVAVLSTQQEVYRNEE